jgi:hypothetical protein
VPELAAICETCHRPFPSGFSVGPGTTAVTVVGVRVAPCPLCGSPLGGVIPDGVLDIGVDDIARLVSALPTTDSELIKLAGILEAADLSPGADPGPVLARIEADVSSAESLLLLLRDPAVGNAINLLSFLLALLAIFGFRA